MNNEEYYKRLEKINNRFKTDRVSADEEYHLVCQKNYLSTKYIEHLEQQCKKQKEAIDKAIELLGNYKHYSTPDEKQNSENEDLVNNAFDILKEVSE